MRFSVIWSIALSTLLVGCGATLPTAPPLQAYSDDSAQPSTYRTFPRGRDAYVALVLTQNTIRHFDYTAEILSEIDSKYSYGSHVAPILDARREVIDPSLMSSWVITSLRQYFGSIAIFEDIATAKATNPDVFAVLDWYFVLNEMPGDKTSARVSLHFYDSSFRKIGQATGSSSSANHSIGPVDTAEIADIIRRDKRIPLTALMKMDQGISQIANKR